MVLRLLGTAWPDFVTDDVSEPGLTWLLIYENLAAQDSWDRLGADPSNEDQLIHVLFHEERQELTLVVGDPDHDIVREILSSLNMNRLFFGNFRVSLPNGKCLPITGFGHDMT